jgi:hypothetical protein
MDWSSDGRFILLGFRTREAAGELWVLPVATENAPPVRIVKGSSTVAGATFSLDGRWIAYLATDTGRTEVFVPPLRRRARQRALVAGRRPAAGVQRCACTRPLEPRRPRVAILSAAGEVMSVDVSALPSLKPDGSRRLFSLPDNYVRSVTAGAAVLGDFASDGSRLLVAMPTTPYRPPALHVLVNWQ